MIFWEDIDPKQHFETSSVIVSKEDILEFAQQFDPQPFHLNQEAADNSIFGGLCASGWHICAMIMRLLAETFQREGIVSMGSPGIPKLKWHKPVYAGDRLSAVLTISSKRTSKSNPAMGIVQSTIEVTNQTDAKVIQMTTTLLVGRRPPATKAAGDSTK